MQSIADPSIGDLQGAAVNSSATEADLKSLMADPRYSDPNKRDIAYVNYVTEQFNKNMEKNQQVKEVQENLAKEKEKRYPTY